jgi:outer membrane protein assembly factor BamB
MPRVEAGHSMEWQRPVVLDDRQFVIGAHHGAIYHVALKDSNELQLVKENQVPGEWQSGLAMVGDILYGVLKTESGSMTVVKLRPADLTVLDQFELKQRVTWGPTRVKGAVFVADASGALRCFDAHAQRWQWNPELGPLAGPPLALADGRFAVAFGRGVLTTIDAEGHVLSTQELSEPLEGSPVSFQGRLLLSGWDGTLYLMDLPK